MSFLTTDGYKFAMAQAGFPLRQETFYLSFRRGGWQYIPFDLQEFVSTELLPLGGPHVPDERFAADHGYGINDAMRQALSMPVTIQAMPAGSWAYEREPILTVTGPSFLVSWLEPLVLRLFFPIQLATELRRHGTEIPDEMLHVTCDGQADIARRVITAVDSSFGFRDRFFENRLYDRIIVDEAGYSQSVRTEAQTLLDIVKDPKRIFEVGMRAATCEGQHRLVLQAIRELGIKATSNVALAQELDMKPVGTMGHEHVQRWGDDLTAYRAMRDMRTGMPSYLLDTFDTITSGIPAAIKAMQEVSHTCAIRYDSGDKYGQYIYAHGEFQRYGFEPIHILEDGLDAEATAKFERLREHTGLDAKHQIYGYGGCLVSRHWDNPLTRDRVSAVYKLSQTSGEPRMKFGNERGLGKISVPGCPVTWRRLRGSGPVSIIAQASEVVPEDYVLLNGNPESVERLLLCNANNGRGDVSYVLSPETQWLGVSLSKGGHNEH